MISLIASPDCATAGIGATARPLANMAAPARVIVSLVIVFVLPQPM